MTNAYVLYRKNYEHKKKKKKSGMPRLLTHEEFITNLAKELIWSEDRQDIVSLMSAAKSVALAGSPDATISTQGQKSSGNNVDEKKVKEFLASRVKSLTKKACN